MKIRLYQIDAFAVPGQPFSGNPAAVCPLDAWLPDDLMQGIALENNLSETAFLVAEGQAGHYGLRWFTPSCEVDLCGHATLASAYAVFSYLQPELDEVAFATRSGELRVRRAGDLLNMDFPSLRGVPCATPDGLAEALGADILETHASDDLMVVVEDAATVVALDPDFGFIAAHVEQRGVIVTAAGEGAAGNPDFVSRFFGPSVGIDEDPATGSAHCITAPYWAARLGKTTLLAHQLSARGGTITCEVAGDRVILSGTAAPYLEGWISL